MYTYRHNLVSTYSFYNATPSTISLESSSTTRFKLYQFVQELIFHQTFYLSDCRSVLCLFLPAFLHHNKNAKRAFCWRHRSREAMPRNHELTHLQVTLCVQGGIRQVSVCKQLPENNTERPHVTLFRPRAPQDCLRRHPPDLTHHTIFIT